MCGLFGTHKNHKISTTAEMQKINDDIADTGREFLKSSVDIANLKTCQSYADYLQVKAKEKVKSCKSHAMKMYEVG